MYIYIYIIHFLYSETIHDFHIPAEVRNVTIVNFARNLNFYFHAENFELAIISARYSCVAKLSSYR